MTTLLLMFALAGAPAETFTGSITDTMCGAHHGMLKDQPDDQCIRMCLKGSSEYALFDGKEILKLSDQKAPGKYSGKRVRVTGTLNPKTKTIKVTSIESIE